MKKLFILLIALSIPNCSLAYSYVDKQLKEVKKNTRYNTVKIHKRNYFQTDYSKVNITKPKNIKDPKLIKLSDFTPVDEKAYKDKLQKDELIYKSQIMPALKKKSGYSKNEPAAVDFYNVYRISEKLIRANNLNYVNWRIAIRKSTDVNASSFNGNYITINTALYDSLYTSDDALAFVIAHEMSHLILGHQLRTQELSILLNDLYSNYKRCKKDAIASAGLLIQMRIVFNELKMMEYMADAEAMILLTKAGYTPYKAMEALNFLESISHIEYALEAHPATAKRIASANENISFANPD